MYVYISSLFALTGISTQQIRRLRLEPIHTIFIARFRWIYSNGQFHIIHFIFFF